MRWLLGSAQSAQCRPDEDAQLRALISAIEHDLDTCHFVIQL